MTKDELITKQQLQIEHYKKVFSENTNLKRKMIGKFCNIGQPLNDNVLKMNKPQMKWCFEVVRLAEQINITD